MIFPRKPQQNAFEPREDFLSAESKKRQRSADPF